MRFGRHAAAILNRSGGLVPPDIGVHAGNADCDGEDVGTFSPPIGKQLLTGAVCGAKIRNDAIEIEGAFVPRDGGGRELTGKTEKKRPPAALSARRGVIQSKERCA